MVGFARFAIVFLGLAALALAGCPSGDKGSKGKGITPKAGNYKFDKDGSGKSEPTPDENEVADARKKQPEAAKPEPVAPPPPPPTVPEVLLSDELRSTCLVNVGDAMPRAELADLEGKTHQTGSLYGPNLTVVCFWTIGSTPRSKLTAEAVLQDMMKKVVKQFAGKGVNVIAINVGDDEDAVKEYASKAGADFPVLLDPRGDYYAGIATERKNPRLFLLDADGKIIWFDLEYSNTALRNLTQGIEASLLKM